MTGRRPPAALYIHLPFCVSLCPYCDFVVYSGAAARGPRNRVAALVDAVLEEIRLRADLHEGEFGAPGAARPPLASVYLGGGTPSLVAADRIGELLALVERRFGLTSDAEITLEANPGPDDLGDLAGFRAAGVTRLSLGAQSLQAPELRRLGRRHTPDDVGRAVRGARTAGLASVSLDLLYDVPGQTLASWGATVEAAVDLAPDHVSAYALTLDDPDAEGLTGTLGDHLPTRPGARRWRAAATAEQDPDRAAEMYEHLDDRLAASGFAWYELSNFARPGRQSRHNLAYWQRRSYEAVGPGAHAFDGGRERRWNAARLDGYIAALRPADGSAPRLPPGARETLDDRAVVAEEAILALRLASGLGPDLAESPAVAPTVAWGREMGLVADGPAGHAVLTRRGRLLSNEMFARLL